MTNTFSTSWTFAVVKQFFIFLRKFYKSLELLIPLLALGSGTFILMGTIAPCNAWHRSKLHHACLPLSFIYCWAMSCLPEYFVSIINTFSSRPLWSRFISPSLNEYWVTRSTKSSTLFVPPVLLQIMSPSLAVQYFPLTLSDLSNALIQIFRRAEFSTIISCKNLFQPDGCQVALILAPFEA